MFHFISLTWEASIYSFHSETEVRSKIYREHIILTKRMIVLQTHISSSCFNGGVLNTTLLYTCIFFNVYREPVSRFQRRDGKGMQRWIWRNPQRGAKTCDGEEPWWQHHSALHASPVSGVGNKETTRRAPKKKRYKCGEKIITPRNGLKKNGGYNHLVGGGFKRCFYV